MFKEKCESDVSLGERDGVAYGMDKVCLFLSTTVNTKFFCRLKIIYLLCIVKDIEDKKCSLGVRRPGVFLGIYIGHSL